MLKTLARHIMHFPVGDLSPIAEARQDAVVIERPRPMELSELGRALSPAELAEYRSLTSELGIQTPELTFDDMVEFCYEHGMKVYNNKAVDAYLQAQAKRINAASPRGRQVYVNWRPVSEVRDPIPLRVLRNVKVIRDAFPDKRDSAGNLTRYGAQFQVSRIDSDPDPFIGWIVPNASGATVPTLVIFDCWDEPGYTG